MRSGDGPPLPPPDARGQPPRSSSPEESNHCPYQRDFSYSERPGRFGPAGLWLLRGPRRPRAANLTSQAVEGLPRVPPAPCTWKRPRRFGETVPEAAQQWLGVSVRGKSQVNSNKDQGRQARAFFRARRQNRVEEDECCCWELGAFSHGFGVTGQQKGDTDAP